MMNQPEIPVKSLQRKWNAGVKAATEKSRKSKVLSKKTGGGPPGDLLDETSERILSVETAEVVFDNQGK